MSSPAPGARAIGSLPHEAEGVLDPPEPLLLASASRERHLLRLHGIHPAQPSDRPVGGDRLGRLMIAREESTKLRRDRLEHGPVPRLLFSIHHARASSPGSTAACGPCLWSVQ
jgi:hypothetical protein